MKIAIVLVAACLVLLGCQRASPVASVPNNSVLTNGSLDYAETWRRRVAAGYNYCLDQGAALAGVSAAEAPRKCRCAIDTLYTYPSDGEADILGRALLGGPMSESQRGTLAIVQSNMDAEGSRRGGIDFSRSRVASRGR